MEHGVWIDSLQLSKIQLLFLYLFQACSIGLTFYNRHLFHHFDAPIASTTCHFFITFALCGFTRKVRQCVTGHNAILLGWSDYAKKLIPTGLISALGFGFIFSKKKIKV